MLWTHICDHFQRQRNDTTTTEELRDFADDWLNTYGMIKAGQSLRIKAIKKFDSSMCDATSAILSDPKVKIVVSTCNNSALLREHGFEPEACLIDEATSGFEQDVGIPLCLNAKYLIISGDQLQRPTVKSEHFNEYFNQLSMSVFERALRNNGVPLFQLRTNYQMHSDEYSS